MDPSNKAKQNIAANISQLMDTNAVDIFDSLGIGIIQLDRDLRVICLNPAAAGFLGQTQEELTGKLFRDGIPEDIQEEFSNEIRRALHEKTDLSIEEFFPDPINLWLNCRCKPYGDGLIIAIKDITGSKHTEKELRQSKDHFGTFMENLPILVIIKDHELRPVYFNRRYNEMFPSDQWLGKTPEEVFPEEIASRMREKDTLALIMGSVQYEETWTDKNGREHIFETRKFRIDREESTPLLAVVINDITEHKRAEDALQKSEEEYRLIVEHAPAAIYELDYVGPRFKRVNEAMCQVLGYTREELLRTNPIDLLDEESRVRFKERILKVLSGDKIDESVSFRVIAKDGRAIWTNLNVKIEYENGRPAGALVIAHDHTERKRIEDALRESEEKFKGLSDASPAAVFVYRGKKHLYVNQAAVSIFGYTREELLEMDFIDFMHPDFRDMAKQRALARMKGYNKQERYEMKVITKTGEEKYLDVSSGAVNYAGSPAGIVVAIDITKRKQAEEELLKYRERLEELVHHRTQDLEEKNALLAKEISDREKIENDLIITSHYTRSLLEASLDPFVAIDTDGKITDVNEATVKALGKEREALIGSKYFDYFTEPDKARSGFKEALIHDSIRDYPLEIIHSDGSVTPVLCNASIYRDKAGAAVGVFAAARDISKIKRTEESLKESEARYRLLADNASDVIFTLDTDLRFTYISPSVTRIRGFTVEEAMSQTLDETLTSASMEFATRVYKEELENEARESKGLFMFRTLELEQNCKDGSTIWTENTFSPLRDEKGVLTGILGICRDITERKQAEKDKKDLENQLIQVQKIEALDRFAGGIAHDLNNILYPIIINIEELLEMESQGSARHDVLNQTLKAAYRQRDLVKKILSFSRRSERVLQPAGIKSLLGETVNFLRSSLPSTIRIQQNISAKHDVVMGDPVQIQQVIMNLCKNAEDAYESGKGTIDIGLMNTHMTPMHSHQDMRAGEYLKLTVKDSGKGMKPEVMDRIFEPFFTNKGIGKGTGLGLSVVHGIVKSHGGAITVESDEGKGSLFTVYLPVSHAEHRAQASGAESMPSLKGKESILLVDDEAFILSSLQRVLKASGYRVTALGDGREAFRLFNENPDEFDLVITDLTMPSMTGLDLSRKIQSVRPGIPIVLCTGYNDVISQEEAKSFGIKELLLKPVGSTDLKKVILRALEQ